MLSISTSTLPVPQDMVPIIISALQYRYLDPSIPVRLCKTLRNLIDRRRCVLTGDQVGKLLEMIKYVGHRPTQTLLCELILFVEPTAKLLNFPLRTDMIDRINLGFYESTSVISIRQPNGVWYDFGTMGIDVRDAAFIPYHTIQSIELVDNTLTCTARRTITLSRLSLWDVVRLSCFGPLQFLPGWNVPAGTIRDGEELRAKVSYLGEDIKMLWEMAKDRLNRLDDVTNSDALKYLRDSVNQYACYSKYLKSEVPSPIDKDMMELVARYRSDRCHLRYPERQRQQG
ncbi:developmentally-regulated protein [Acrasis kona]|uniref:Developmentally-regulated protein n=1 Tax=Acrasis kona TaxID=1008807 RepID=A0AAW2YHN2_9EUKA